jgi:CRP-like cAMP-binding protein/glyoxylase-like metal-dependent hydrolase (beta-lactamase superfamily II)
MIPRVPTTLPSTVLLPVIPSVPLMRRPGDASHDLLTSHMAAGLIRDADQQAGALTQKTAQRLAATCPGHLQEQTTQLAASSTPPPPPSAPSSADKPGGADGMGPIGKPFGSVKVLDRGGVAIYTSQGWVQIGVPMGSHLDGKNMFFENGGIPGKMSLEDLPHYLPTHIVFEPDYVPDSTRFLPADFFRYLFFFPVLQKEQAMFNYYMPTKAMADRIAPFLKEAYQGENPAALTSRVQEEHAPGEEGVPDLGAETQAFKGKAYDEFVSIGHFSEVGTMLIGDGSVTVKKTGFMRYEIIDNGRVLVTIDLTKDEFALPTDHVPFDKNVMYDAKFQEVKHSVLIEGKAGVWPITTSDYFSGEGTSGFMLWKDGKVTLIDPPSETIAYFLQNGIPLNAIEGILITHDHTDHLTDAVMKLMRLVPKLNFYATRTLYNIYQRAYFASIALNGQPEGLTQFNFVKIDPRQFTEVRGMWIRPHYTCHSVAAIGFGLWTAPSEEEGDLAMYFTGDTMANKADLEAKFPDMHPARMAEILRYQYLLESTWEQENPPAILIEAGMKGLHTDPAATLVWLTGFAARKGVPLADVLERVRFYHTSQASAEQAGVPKWQPGHKGFISLDNHFPRDNDANINLKFIEWSPILARLSDEQKLRLAQEGILRTDIRKNDLLMIEGQQANDQVHLIISGGFDVFSGGQRVTSLPFGLVGEAALLDEARNATIKASMPSVVLSFSAKLLAEVFHESSQTNINRNHMLGIRRVRELRSSHYEAIVKAFPNIPNQILTPILQIAKQETVPAGKNFIMEGDYTEQDAFIIVGGDAQVWFHDSEATIDRVPGDVVGEMSLLRQSPRNANVRAMSDVTVLRLPAAALSRIMNNYPAIRIYLQRLAYKRHQQLTQASLGMVG